MSSPASSYLYDLQVIHKTRRSGNVAFELHIPRFQVSFGEFVAVAGPSGCGKSTLLDLLAMVLRPDGSHGSVFRFSSSLGGASEADIYSFWQQGLEDRIAAIRKRHIGYVLQTGGLLPFLTVRSNIELPCRLNGIGSFDRKVDSLAGELGIQGQLSKKPQYLSGGERQRAAIARAMIHSPAVVLADEPTAAVDRDRAMAIVAQFNLLAKERQTGIVMVTHDHSLIERVADRRMTFHLESRSNIGIETTISTIVEGN